MDYHYKENFLVGYGEVDQHNRMKLSSLLNFLQDIATMHSKTIGYGTTKCKELGIGWMLLSWQIKMYSYPKGDTNVEIKTWSRGIKGIHAGRAYEVVDEDGNLVAQVDSIWALVDVNTKRPMRPLPGMADSYGAIERNFFENEKVRIDTPENVDNVVSLKVQRRDIDTNRHCNNTKYIEYAIEAVPQEIFDKMQIEELQIVYRKPVVYNENIKVTFSKVQGNEYVSTVIKEDGESATTIKTKWKPCDLL